MTVSTQLLFFFSALGAFNGLLLAVYLLFFLRPPRLSNRLLGLLLLALSVRIGKSVFMYFNQETAPLFLQIGLTACFFIGPLLLAYLVAARDGLEKVPHSWWWVLAGLTAIVLGVGWWRPYVTNRDFWSHYFIHFIYTVWTIGLVASAGVLWPVLKRGRKRWTVSELWWVNVFVGNVIVHLAYRYGAYNSYIVGALSFSLVFYLLALWYILQRKETNFLVRERPKYVDKKIEADAAAALLARCQVTMEKERLFLQSDLKLEDLAQAVGSSSHQLSQVLNDNLGQSFASYVRTYRVEHAQARMLIDDHLTLEAIGLEAGFGSKSSFYTAFREVVGTTPAKFRAQQKSTTRNGISPKL
ncbi:MAG: helix-turn-helix domain-containing protein [Bacteroidota bacterium]